MEEYNYYIENSQHTLHSDGKIFEELWKRNVTFAVQWDNVKPVGFSDVFKRYAIIVATFDLRKVKDLGFFVEYTRGGKMYGKLHRKCADHLMNDEEIRYFRENQDKFKLKMSTNDGKFYDAKGGDFACHVKDFTGYYTDWGQPIFIGQKITDAEGRIFTVDVDKEKKYACVWTEDEAIKYELRMGNGYTHLKDRLTHNKGK